MDINDWPLNMQPFAFTEQPTAGTKRPNPSLPYENPVTKRPYLQFNSQGKTVDLLGSVLVLPSLAHLHFPPQNPYTGYIN